jgi:hypothetical protein
MRNVLPVLLFGIVLSCGPAFADGDGTGAMGQLQGATSGNQTLQQTYGDQGHDEKCPDACPTGSGDVPDVPPPTPVDSGNGQN